MAKLSVAQAVLDLPAETKDAQIEETDRNSIIQNITSLNPKPETTVVVGDININLKTITAPDFTYSYDSSNSFYCYSDKGLNSSEGNGYELLKIIGLGPENYTVKVSKIVLQGFAAELDNLDKDLDKLKDQINTSSQYIIYPNDTVISETEITISGDTIECGVVNSSTQSQAVLPDGDETLTPEVGNGGYNGDIPNYNKCVGFKFVIKEIHVEITKMADIDNNTNDIINLKLSDNYSSISENGGYSVQNTDTCLVGTSLTLNDLAYEPNINGHRLFVKNLKTEYFGMRKGKEAITREIFYRDLYDKKGWHKDYTYYNHLYLLCGPCFTDTSISNVKSDGIFSDKFDTQQ